MVMTLPLLLISENVHVYVSMYVDVFSLICILLET